MTDDSPIRGFGPETFGALNAETYDDEHAPATQQGVDFLARLARGGSVLEFAIGTGRIALPLAERGLAVAGVEASAEMIAKLRAKPGGETIPVTLGDMSEVAPEGAFDVVVLVFNTLFNLTSQDAQVRCFANAARKLTDEGAFVIEAFVPDIGLFNQPDRVRARGISMRSLFIEAALHDPVGQVIRYQRMVFLEGGQFRLIPLPMRYAWPAELDLMARLAGLELAERWADWDGSPFTAASRSHISVYRRVAASSPKGLPRA
jgi:SAM-dependent methyltransferase